MSNLISDPFKPFREWNHQIEKMLEPIRRVQRDVDRMHRLAMGDQLRAILEPQLRLQQATRDLLAQYEQQLQSVHEAFMQHQLRFDRDLDQWQKLLRSIASRDLERIRINPSGTLSVDGATVNRDEVDTEVRSLVAIFSEALSVEDLFDRLVSYARRAKTPVAKAVSRFLIAYLIGISVNLTMPLYEPLWGNLRPGSTREQTAEVRHRAFEIYEADQLQYYRFVAARHLNVRSEGRRDASVMTVLPLGQVVRVIRIENRWALVEFSEDDDIRSGWVFSRYLARFVH